MRRDYSVSLISINEAAIRYDKSTHNFMSTAHKYKKKYDEYPKWYVSNGQSVKINTDEYEYLGILEHEAWVFSTDQLFWAFQDLDICCMEISRMLSRMSEKYTSVISWNSFIANNLFSIPPDIVLVNDKSMRIEFLQYGTAILLYMKKNGDYMENVKNRVHPFTYIYGCGLDDLPLTKSERLNLHDQQAVAGRNLLHELVKPMLDKQDRERIKAVQKAIKFNELMIEQLKNEGKQNGTR